MKTEDEIKAEFEKWWNTLSSKPLSETDAGKFVRFAFTSGYQICQQLNNIVITEKDAEIAKLKDSKIALQALWNAKQMKKNNYSGYEQAKIRAWDLARKAQETTNE